MSLFKKKKKHLETTTMDYGVRMITVSKSGSANTEQFNTLLKANRPLRPTWPFRLLVKARKRCWSIPT